MRPPPAEQNIMPHSHLHKQHATNARCSRGGGAPRCRAGACSGSWPPRARRPGRAGTARCSPSRATPRPRTAGSAAAAPARARSTPDSAQGPPHTAAPCQEHAAAGADCACPTRYSAASHINGVHAFVEAISTASSSCMNMQSDFDDGVVSAGYSSRAWDCIAQCSAAHRTAAQPGVSALQGHPACMRGLIRRARLEAELAADDKALRHAQRVVQRGG